MASSPEPATPERTTPEHGPAQDGVRWPLVAKLGLALAIVTVVGAIIAAVFAAFVVDRDEDAGQSRLTAIEQVFDTEGHGSCGVAQC